MMSREVLSYQFDDVVIDLRAGRVLRAGTAAPLEPKAYDLLVLLASRSGELVTRQEVLDRVWAGVYVTDNAVARVIAQVRRVLGDSAKGSRYIETVPTRGYRFIVPVTRHAGLPRPAGQRSGCHRTRTATTRPVAALTDQRPSSPRASRRIPPQRLRQHAGHPFWAAGLAVVALWPSCSPGDRRRPHRPRSPAAVVSHAHADHLVGRAGRLPGLVA